MTPGSLMTQAVRAQVKALQWASKGYELYADCIFPLKSLGPPLYSSLPQSASPLLACVNENMADSELLQELLDQSGMPNQQWWGDAESAYDSMCQILMEDINTEEQSNCASRPMVVIRPLGNYACKLSSRNELLSCVAFGTVRTDLFIEVAWQNISRAQHDGSNVRVYEATERQILLGISEYRFNLHYLESPELVRQFPTIVNVSRAVQEELQDKTDEIVETIRDLKLVREHIEQDRSFSQIYYTLRVWMISSGLYQIDNGGRSLRLSKKSIACFDGDLLRELTWNIHLMNEEENNPGDISAKILHYLLRHQSCLQSSTNDSCSLYDDSQGPFARKWSDNHFRVAHEEFRTLNIALTGETSCEPNSRHPDGELRRILNNMSSKPLVDRFLRNSYIRVTIQYCGQSQLAGTGMMQFMEEKILDLIHTLEISTEEKNRLRPWPTRLVDVNAKEDDHPYEGYWLIGINFDGKILRKTLESVLSKWNEKICASHRYNAPTMVIHGDLINRDTLLQQNFKEDTRDWPLPLAKPDPRYTLDQTTKDAPKPTAIAEPSIGPRKPQTPRKLRPAMDVLSRLKHDSAFDLDDYVVGYTDRHAGIQEKAAGSWVSESTDEEFIPQARIQFFKRISDGKRVWDRVTKYDCVFR